MTLRTALEQGIKLLEEGNVGVPRLTAEVLLAHALRRERVYLFAHPEEELAELGWIHYGRYLHQRLSGVPTQYITKKQEFYGRDFLVTPDVLIPRPETEHLVSAVLELVTPSAVVVDVGTGSGAIAVSVALESKARVFATDISSGALRVASENARTLGAAVGFVQCDLVYAISSADVIASNPPYVGLNEADGLQREVREHEPHVALFAGSDGNCLYRRLVRDAERVLTPGGWLALELGWRSLDAVRAMMGSGWSEVNVVDDLAGIARVIRGRWTP